MTKASRLTISAKVGPPTVSKDGASVVVKKTLGEGATLVETFPKHRVRGKTKQAKQLIPVEDVVRAVQAAEEATRKERAEGERKLAGLQELANRVVDQKVGEEKARTRFQKGKAAAANVATKAATEAADNYRRQLNERRMLGRLRRVADASEAVRDAYHA